MEPVRPSLTAVMDVEPGASAKTVPVALTDATLGLPLDHSTVRPESVAPEASRRVAVAVVDSPVRIELFSSATETDDTGEGPIGEGGPPLSPHAAVSKTRASPLRAEAMHIIRPQTVKARNTTRTCAPKRIPSRHARTLNVEHVTEADIITKAHPRERHARSTRRTCERERMRARLGAPCKFVPVELGRQ